MKPSHPAKPAGSGSASLEQEVFLDLMRTASELGGRFDQLFRTEKLSSPLYNVLRILRGQRGQGLACSLIGGHMVTRVPDITRLVDKLVQLDLARRERSLTDRRVVEIFITEQGLTVLARLDEPVADLHQATLGHMNAKELNQLNTLLAKARNTP